MKRIAQDIRSGQLRNLYLLWGRRHICANSIATI